jgi:coenzyme F420-reducing hydrogenase gamma subunit
MDRSFTMTLGRAEFMRLLPAAVGGEFEVEETAGTTLLTHQGEGGNWRIRLVPLPPQHLGPIAMERLQVDLAFEGCPPEAEDAFVERFLQGYQRGGG